MLPCTFLGWEESSKILPLPLSGKNNSSIALAVGIVFLLFFPINKKTIAEIHAKTKPKNL